MSTFCEILHTDNDFSDSRKAHGTVHEPRNKEK